ncbi:ATP-binding protein [Sphaerisporangium corydalis]|uniref:ATP-binding protein n=1 Tax=Sphaerisporangium corydalis TaxID=1441875 RepID=A0ABV9EFL5_9ACTN|nr:ATP-binding protein [Sphaerisporangium corydalis]
MSQVLLVSELTANAIRHSDSGRHPCGQITVIIESYGRLLHIEVIDDGSAESTAELEGTANPDFERGRGLWLVDQMAARWGTRHDQSKHAVWFQIVMSCPKCGNEATEAATKANDA